ncbi:Oxidoreductase [hydrothermal vent metagenome]|uniref:Oxidoreductase n=1 Tax=hydrothermal vent metagenome TaxID=652676 RepID=A0A3B0TMZ1_9ZZZZ
MEKVRIVVLGTGSMAASHVEAFAAHPRAEVVAGVDTDAGRLAEFAAKTGVSRGFAGLDQALAWGEFDAVANVTPDPVHHATTLQCLAAGKHVFCEKPLAETYADALEMTEAAEAAGVVNMVNLRYRANPVIARAGELVAAGAVGEVRHVAASYLQSWLIGSHWGDWKTETRWLWRLSAAHGSKGTLGDIGIHILDATTLVAGAAATSVHCRLKTYPKAPGDRIGDYNLDVNDSFVMSAELEGGALATMHATRMAPGYANAISINVYGTEGGLELAFDEEAPSLRLCNGADVNTQAWRHIDCPKVPQVYDRFVEAVLAGRNGSPDFRRAADLQNVLDLCIVSNGDGRNHSV